MKKKLILTSVAILFLALVILLVFKIKQKEAIPQKSNIDQINQADQGQPIINSLALSSFPETKWLSYQNNDLEITFNYPDKAIPNMYWTSYDAVNQVIRPNIVLAKDNILYIKSGECSFNSVETEYQKNKQKYGDGFGLDPVWRITVADIKNEQELSDFIKKHYGKSCSYHKEPIAIFPDTFDIILDGDDKSLDVSECPVNYSYYLKYNPVNKKIASWNTSQECQIGYGFEKCFDKQIAESFHFIKQTDLKICPSEVSEFRFSYPKTWGDCRVDGQKISFRTDFKEYNVDLVAEVRETSSELAKGFMDYSIKQEKIAGINNGIVYRGVCGGAMACSVLNIDDQKFYEIDWGVVSNQSVPENLDGVWVPDYSFTEDDIWTILRSIKN